MPRKARNDSLADDNAAPGGVAAVDRALTLLCAFRAGDSTLSLTELAERTRLYKSTALRLLSSLEHSRLVQRVADGSYALGSELVRLNAVYASSSPLERTVTPVLRELVAATGESAAYHVRQGQPPNQTRMCLFRVDSPHTVRDHIRVGDVLPLDRGAGGRVLSAFGAGDESAAPTRADRRAYARIREQGYCAIVGDRVGEVAGIAAPVFDADGQIAAALTLTMPANRYDERYVPQVLAAAKNLNGRV
jgi:DNA-binding IclR family transcriptional regulator